MTPEERAQEVLDRWGDKRQWLRLDEVRRDIAKAISDAQEDMYRELIRGRRDEKISQD